MKSLKVLSLVLVTAGLASGAVYAKGGMGGWHGHGEWRLDQS